MTRAPLQVHSVRKFYAEWDDFWLLIAWKVSGDEGCAAWMQHGWGDMLTIAQVIENKDIKRI